MCSEQSSVPNRGGLKSRPCSEEELGQSQSHQDAPFSHSAQGSS